MEVCEYTNIFIVGSVTVESMTNGREIYYRIKYEIGMPKEVDSSEE